MIDISLVDDEVQVSSGGEVYKTFATPVNTNYRFDSDSRLQIAIGGQPFQIPFANLTINGVAPASQSAALLALSEMFAASEGVDGSVPSYVSATLATYDTNADAVAEIGVGKLYKSSTLINGSPIMLITI